MRRLAVVTLVLSALPSLVRAQAVAQADSLGPRARSWAVEGTIAPLQEASLLRFFSRRVALVVTGSVDNQTGTVTFSGPFTADTTEVGDDYFRVAAGVRMWMRDSGRVRAFWGAGGSFLYDHTRGQGTAVTVRGPAGYGELGLSAFVFPRISLNGSAQASVERRMEDAGPDLRYRGWEYAGRLAQLSLTVYF